ncbi:MAG: hypothetical protein IJK51_00660 [Bacteroidaceae bacterium]|nr:hypothetical protein [Bacteroidaceae bacterium]
MKKLLASALFVLIGLFIVDRLGGMVMWWVNQHTYDVSGPKIKYLVGEVHEDVVMMGTSRCDVHYVPSIIRDALGMSVYNGGINASDNIYAHYIMLNHILARHVPKIICLEVMTNDFTEQEDPFNTISFFAPYFGKNEGADSVFRLAGKYWIYRISHLYRYNAKATSNIAGLVINRHKGGDNGYIPVPKPAHFPKALKHSPTPQATDSLKIEYVNRFVSLCKKKGVKLIFTVAPEYTKVDSDHYDVLKGIAKQYGIPFMDYHTAGLYHDHPEYFKDCLHLWDKGARLYSSVFAHDLKKILEEETN